MPKQNGELGDTSHRLSLDFLEHGDTLPCPPHGTVVRTETVRAWEELGQTASTANAQEVLVVTVVVVTIVRASESVSPD